MRCFRHIRKKKVSYTRVRMARKIIMLNNKAAMFISETHFNHVRFTTYTVTYAKAILVSCSGWFRLVTVQFSMLPPSLFFPCTQHLNISFETLCIKSIRLLQRIQKVQIFLFWQIAKRFKEICEKLNRFCKENLKYFEGNFKKSWKNIKLIKNLRKVRGKFQENVKKIRKLFQRNLMKIWEKMRDIW